MGRIREEKRREEERRSEKRKSQSRKVVNHCVFSNGLWLGRVESRLAKAASAEPFGGMGDEKLHAVVARNAFRSQNAQNTMFGALSEVEI